jgi:hypothetical protein
LNDFAEFFVLDNCAITSEFLLEDLEDFLGFKFLWEALDGG